MRHQKCRWSLSHSKFYFTSAIGKVALATEKKNNLVLHSLTHPHTTSRFWSETTDATFLIAKVYGTPVQSQAWFGC